MAQQLEIKTAQHYSKSNERSQRETYLHPKLILVSLAKQQRLSALFSLVDQNHVLHGWVFALPSEIQHKTTMLLSPLGLLVCQFENLLSLDIALILEQLLEIPGLVGTLKCIH